MKSLGLPTVELQSKEGLALLNGTQFMSAHAVLVMLKALSSPMWLIFTVPFRWRHTTDGSIVQGRDPSGEAASGSDQISSKYPPYSGRQPAP
jgi:hypothetical protein